MTVRIYRDRLPFTSVSSADAIPSSLQSEPKKTRVIAMSTVAEIEAAIMRLPVNEAEELREWLEQ